MADERLGDGEISSATAVLLGALAPGINGPAWTTLRSSFVMLGLCLALMLALANRSSRFPLLASQLVSIRLV